MQIKERQVGDVCFRGKFYPGRLSGTRYMNDIAATIKMALLLLVVLLALYYV